MTSQNSIPSARAAVLGEIDPVSTATTVVTGWIAVANFHRLLAVIQTGTLGASATVDAKLQQATAAAGTNAKDITGKAITQIVKATGDNKQALINLDAEQLDIAGGFTHVQLSITVGTAASLVSGLLLGFDPRFAPASDNDAASVVQIVV